MWVSIANLVRGVVSADCSSGKTGLVLAILYGVGCDDAISLIVAWRLP